MSGGRTRKSVCTTLGVWAFTRSDDALSCSAAWPVVVGLGLRARRDCVTAMRPRAEGIRACSCSCSERAEVPRSCRIAVRPRTRLDTPVRPIRVDMAMVDMMREGLNERAVVRRKGARARAGMMPPG